MTDTVLVGLVCGATIAALFGLTAEGEQRQVAGWVCLGLCAAAGVLVLAQVLR